MWVPVVNDGFEHPHPDRSRFFRTKDSAPFLPPQHAADLGINQVRRVGHDRVEQPPRSLADSTLAHHGIGDNR
jgi:hypothetical protein